MLHDKKPTFQLRKDRDTGETINATFEFLRVYAPSLYKALLYVAMPMGLISGVLIGLFSVNVSGGFGTLGAFSGIDSLLSWEYITGLCISLMEIVVMSCLVYGFFTLLMKHKGRHEFSVEEVIQAGKSIVWKVLGASLVFAIAFIVLMVFISVIFGALVGISQSPVMAFLMVIAIIFAFIYVMVSTVAYFPVVVVEERDMMTAFSRSMALVADRRLRTFAVIFVIGTISWLMNMALSMPALILQSAVGLNSADGEASGVFMSVALVLLSGLSAAATTLIQPIAYVALTLHYFSLVEAQESVGLIEQIGFFGTKEDDHEAEEAY